MFTQIISLYVLFSRCNLAFVCSIVLKPKTCSDKGKVLFNPGIDTDQQYSVTMIKAVPFVFNRRHASELARSL
jgi:hypothetical protein